MKRILALGILKLTESLFWHTGKENSGFSVQQLNWLFTWRWNFKQAEILFFNYIFNYWRFIFVLGMKDQTQVAASQPVLLALLWIHSVF